MKITNFIIILIFGGTFFIGCSGDNDNIWGTTKTCFRVKDDVTNNRIEGATVKIYGYNHPGACIDCPININRTSDSRGKACFNFSDGYYYSYAYVSANGYHSQTFEGNRSLPLFIHLTPISN